MGHPAYADLFDRIRAYQVRPEVTPFEALVSRLSGRGPNPHGFAWPPATEEQVRTTEDRLGFPLPHLLRALYTELANGGFGPAYGIIGAVGGAPHLGDWYQDIAEGYLQCESYVDLETIAAARHQRQRFELTDYAWPRYMLPLCYWGCNTMHSLYVPTGEIFVVVDGSSFANWVPSLEEWLEQWLAGTLQQE